MTTLRERASYVTEIEQTAVDIINLNTTLRANISGQDGDEVLIPVSVIEQLLKDHARIAQRIVEYAMNELKRSDTHA